MNLIQVWRKWTAPTTSGDLARRREAVLLNVLVTMICLSIATQAVQLVSIAVDPDLRVVNWWLLNLGVGLSFYVLLRVARSGRHRAATVTLVGIVCALVVWQELVGGIDNPMAVLLLALALLLAAILLGARTSMVVLAFGAVIVLPIAVLQQSGTLEPVAPVESTSSRTGGDGVVGALAVLGAMAAICWLYTRDVLTSIDEALTHSAASSPLRQLRTKHLTLREVEVVQLVAEGCSNDQIARRLFLSPRTVQSHVANAMKKTTSANRTELGVLALREGLVPIHDDTPRSASTSQPSAREQSSTAADRHHVAPEPT